jgi:hypothetical protein
LVRELDGDNRSQFGGYTAHPEQFFVRDRGSINFQINATYPGVNGAPTGVVIYGGQDTATIAHGNDLTRADIQAIVRDSLMSNRLPVDPNGIYIVVGSSDIASTETGFSRAPYAS